MFRNLGTFALLALCLFALVIAMGGCDPEVAGNTEDDAGTEGVVSPITDPVDGLGISKGDFVDLSGAYTYEAPGLSGVLSLHPAARDFKATLWFITDDFKILDESGSWTAQRGGIELLGRVYRYTWNGTHLTIRNLGTPDGRKDIKWLREEDW